MRLLELMNRALLLWYVFAFFACVAVGAFAVGFAFHAGWALVVALVAAGLAVAVPIILLLAQLPDPFGPRP